MSQLSTRAKLGLLSTLYFSQGLPFGFFVQALPVLLREQGLSLPAISMTSLLALPWALKFAWAPRVDASPRRKRWIVPLQWGSASVMFITAMLDPSKLLWAVLAAVFIANLLAATQDIATDGLAVDELDYEERGLGNGVQVAGYRVGMIVGGGLMLVIFDYTGWALTFGTIGVLLLVASIPILLRDEPPRERTLDDGEPMDWRAILAIVKRPGMASWLLVLVLYKFGESLAGGMLRPYLVDLGMREAQIGWMLGAAGFTSGLLGALAGGWGAQKLGRRRALILFGALQTLGVTLYALAALGANELPMLYLFCIIEHFTGGLATAALFTMMMDRCQEHSGGTDYTVQASVVVLSTGLASSLSGFVAMKFGYAFHFWLGGTLSILGLLAVIALLSRQKEHPAGQNPAGASNS